MNGPHAIAERLGPAPNFPTTPGAFQTTLGGIDAFVTKLNPAGSGLVYSTYLLSGAEHGRLTLSLSEVRVSELVRMHQFP